MSTEKKGLFLNSFKSSKWNSRIRSANTTKKEMWLGYVLGPYGAMLLQSIVNGYYNQYLTDVLGFTAKKGLWIAAFMVAFPIVSKTLDAVANIVMSKIIDNTTCKQGKLRPWMIISAPIIIGSVLMLFWIPFVNPVAQAIWIVIAFNLFYAVGYTMWLVPTELSAPLSTRSIKQRSNNSMALTITKNMGTGLVAILFPSILSLFCRVANGNNAEGYLFCISVICCLALPLFFLQYFYTRERVTEERRNQFADIDDNKGKKVAVKEASLWVQLKTALKDKYWVALICILLIYWILNHMRNVSMVYYSGWVLKGNAYGSYAKVLAKYQMIAMSPMGFGVLILLPLMKKIGRSKCVWGGALLTIVGSAIAFLGAGHVQPIYIGSIIAAFGNIALSYPLMTFIGDVIDHVEWKTGIRVEGITGGFVAGVTCVATGVAQGLFNLGLMATGYSTPTVIGKIAGVTQYADQTVAATRWINLSYQGGYILLGIIFFVVFKFIFDIEKHLPKVHDELQQRKIDECAALGIEYIPADELRRREIAAQKVEAEENRIKELKEKCNRKGLNFDIENKKVLDKRAAKKAKSERKKKQKNKSTSVSS